MRTSSMSSTQHCTPLGFHVSTSMHGLPFRSSIRLSWGYSGRDRTESRAAATGARGGERRLTGGRREARALRSLQVSILDIYCNKKLDKCSLGFRWQCSVNPCKKILELWIGEHQRPDRTTNLPNQNASKTNWSR